jgi:AraC-like DNA-binding protein
MKLLIHGIGSYGPGHEIGPACWPHHDLIIVTEGKMTLRCGRRRLAMLAHDAVLIPPGVAFAGTAGGGGGGIWVQHFAAAVDDLPVSLRRRNGPVLLHAAAGSELAGALRRRLHLLHAGSTGEARRLRHALFGSLLLELAQAPRGRRSGRPEALQIEPALAWAETNLGSVRNLRAIARRANLSESHFRNLFRKLRNQSAGAWLRERRMGEARRLLAATGLTLKEIAAQLGYSDMVSFNRAFGQHHGIPPGRFRKARAGVV